MLRMQAGEVETPLHGAAITRLQLQVGQPFQGSRRAEALFGGVLESLIQLTAHGGEAEPIQFFSQCHDASFSGSTSRNASYSNSESCSGASWLSRGSLSRTGGSTGRGELCWRRILAMWSAPKARAAAAVSIAWATVCGP